MKINWKVRFKNKTWLLSFLTVIVAFVYQILAMLGIVPNITEDKTMEIVTLTITLLASLGIIQDPTTKGLSDSERAMEYDEVE